MGSQSGGARASAVICGNRKSGYGRRPCARAAGPPRSNSQYHNAKTITFVSHTVPALMISSVASSPVPLLIFAGAFNGLLLPIGVAVLLWVAWRRADLLGGYDYPGWLVALGAAAWLVTVYLGWESLGRFGAMFE